MGWVVAYSVVWGWAVDWAREEFVSGARVTAEGMSPTLKPGECVFVDMGGYTRRAPERGDVVTVEVARDGHGQLLAEPRSGLRREQLVKRVIGVPGDVVSVSRAGILLNGNTFPVLALEDRPGRGETVVYRESWGWRSYRIARVPGANPGEPSTFQVPPGQYFVMGDNRHNSADSRHWGTIRRSQITGRVSRFYLAVGETGDDNDWGRIGAVVK